MAFKDLFTKKMFVRALLITLVFPFIYLQCFDGCGAFPWPLILPGFHWIGFFFGPANILLLLGYFLLTFSILAIATTLFKKQKGWVPIVITVIVLLSLLGVIYLNSTYVKCRFAEDDLTIGMSKENAAAIMGFDPSFVGRNRGHTASTINELYHVQDCHFYERGLKLTTSCINACFDESGSLYSLKKRGEPAVYDPVYDAQIKQDEKEQAAAIQTGNESMCDLLTHEVMRNRCYNKVAEAKRR